MTADLDKNQHGSCFNSIGLWQVVDDRYYWDGSDNLAAQSQGPMNANGLFNNAHDLIFYQPVMTVVNETEERGMHSSESVTYSINCMYQSCSGSRNSRWLVPNSMPATTSLVATPVPALRYWRHCSIGLVTPNTITEYCGCTDPLVLGNRPSSKV